MILSSLYIADSPDSGRGVFTSARIKPRTVIEISPVIVMNSGEMVLLDQTTLHDYIFLWGKNDAECCVALGYVSMYNHDYRANAEYEMDFAAATIRITSVREIKKGHEIFINYNGTWDDAKPVWFELKNKGIKK
jgi:uncharacterized protein